MTPRQKLRHEFMLQQLLTVKLIKNDTQKTKRAAHGIHPQAKNQGRKITTYCCLGCKQQIDTLQPRKTEVATGKGYWDSTKKCPECGELAFVRVWPSGAATIEPMPKAAVDNQDKAYEDAAQPV